MRFLNKENSMRIYSCILLLLTITIKLLANPYAPELLLSRTIIKVGDTINITLQSTADKNCPFQWPVMANIIPAPLVVLNTEAISKREKGNLIFYKQVTTVTCYDSGVYTIPAINLKSACPGESIFSTAAQELMVQAVPVNMMGDIKEENIPDKKTLSPAQKKIIWLLTGLLFAGLLWYLYSTFFTKAQRTAMAQVPPYQKALGILNTLQLEVDSLVGYKLFYSQLSDCIKEYIQAEINLPVLDKTSTEMNKIFQQSIFTKQHANTLMALFTRADATKFAQTIWTPEQATLDVRDAQSVVDAIHKSWMDYLDKKAAEEASNKNKL